MKGNYLQNSYIILKNTDIELQMLDRRMPHAFIDHQLMPLIEKLSSK